MAGFLFRWRVSRRTRRLSVAVPDWKAGDTIHFGHGTMRVVGRRDDEADQPPVLVVRRGRSHH